MADFGTLYGYDSNNGTVSVIPDTLAVKAKWETVFKTIFQDANLSVDESSIVGRIIEALTFLCVNVLGVNAQNANALNPNVAPGQCLDAIGKLFGHSRISGESDASYRSRLLQGQSSTQGYSASIRSALSNVSGVTSICVLENNKGEPAVVPNNVYGVTIPAHSVFVCVAGGTSANVANAIYKTKSAGCGYTTSTEYGTPEEVTITDATSGSETDVIFYRPTNKAVVVQVTVSGLDYTGSDIVATTKSAVKEIIANRSINSYITPTLIASAISSSDSGIYCSASSIRVSGSQTTVDMIPARPYEKLTISDSDIIVTVL